MAGRYAVGFDDARKVARAALRHRIHRSFTAESHGLSSDEIARRVIASTPTELAAPVAAPSPVKGGSR
jgi:MoxR-like ATPase